MFGLESLEETLLTAFDMCPPHSCIILLSFCPPLERSPGTHTLHSVPLGIQERLREEKRERERRKRSEPYSHGPASCFIAVAVAAAAGDVGDACPSLGAARPPVRSRLGRVCNLGPAARDGRPPPPQRLSEQRATATAPSLRTSRGRPPVRPTDRPTVSVPFSSSPLHRTRG